MGAQICTYCELITNGIASFFSEEVPLANFQNANFMDTSRKILEALLANFRNFGSIFGKF